MILQFFYKTLFHIIDTYTGFYIGRYETSENANGVQTVTGATPSNDTWYSLYGKQKAYANQKKLSINSSMISGAAYDQVMHFVGTEFDVTQSVENDSSSTTYTGMTSSDCLKNIFDLIGNAYCSTTEAYNVGARVSRNGRTISGSLCPSGRGGLNPETLLAAPLNVTSSIIMLYLPVESYNDNIFPFDWDSEVGYVYPWFVPTFEPINEEFEITSAAFKHSSVVSGRSEVVTVRCSGVEEPSLKIFDMNGDEVVLSRTGGKGDASEYRLQASFTVTGKQGQVLYYTICAMDTENSYASNYKVLSLTIQ